MRARARERRLVLLQRVALDQAEAARKGDAELTEVADIIAATLVHGAAGTADDETLATLRGRVRALTDAFPLYPGLAQ